MEEMMAKGEQAFVDWLGKHAKVDPQRVPIGIGDDMAAVRLGGSLVLITADMLLDGVHFESDKHDLAHIGRKAISCSLSDCAAMACRPVGAVVSVALPNSMSMEEAQRLYNGMFKTAAKYDCPVVGGDTTSWDHPLAIDVAMLAEPMSRRGAVRRDGGKPGDVLLCSGLLGGSRLAKHLSFTPRLGDAEVLVREFGAMIHAMIDISDGLAIDAHRMCRASGCSAVLDESMIEILAGDRAHEAAKLDGRSPIEHALHDGEDYELLIAMHPDAIASLKRLSRVPKVVGKLVAPDEGQEPGLFLRRQNSVVEPLEPRGYEHFT